MNLERQDNEIK